MNINTILNSRDFETRDMRRILDIVAKAESGKRTAVSYAEQMAKAITKEDKALRRARAAFIAGQKDLAVIFFGRYLALCGVV